jgi:hypothetical protein
MEQSAASVPTTLARRFGKLSSAQA